MLLSVGVIYHAGNTFGQVVFILVWIHFKTNWGIEVDVIIAANLN